AGQIVTGVRVVPPVRPGRRIACEQHPILKVYPAPPIEDRREGVPDGRGPRANCRRERRVEGHSRSQLGREDEVVTPGAHVRIDVKGAMVFVHHLGQVLVGSAPGCRGGWRRGGRCGGASGRSLRRWGAGEHSGRGS
ncbi:MAG: hypothetical protein NZ653_07455, partial [Anaerolineae bacterium]|nr:hypothetical protein [Anaerolineae bacterium]